LKFLMVWSEELIWLISCYCSIKSLPFSYKTVRARQAYFQLVATEKRERERERTRGGEGERETEREKRIANTPWLSSQEL